MSQKKQKPQGSKSHTKQPAKSAARFQLWWAIVAIALLALGGYWIFQQNNAPAETDGLPLEICVNGAHQKSEGGVFLLGDRTPVDWVG